MTHQDFVFWLEGYLEDRTDPQSERIKEKVEEIAPPMLNTPHKTHYPNIYPYTVTSP